MSEDNPKQIGILISVAVLVIVGLILFQASAGNVGNASNTISVTDEAVNASTAFIDSNNINESKTFYVTNNYINSNTYKQGYDSSCYMTLTLENKTGSVVLVEDTDFDTITNYGSFHLINSTDSLSIGTGGIINSTYTYCPDGYLNGNSTRSIAWIIIVMTALAVAAITLIPALRSKVFDM